MGGESISNMNVKNNGAGSGIRTHKSNMTRDFKSPAYANSAIPAFKSTQTNILYEKIDDQTNNHKYAYRFR